MRGIAAEGGASAVYPLTSTVRLHLSSADLTFGQSRCRHLPTSTRRLLSSLTTKNRIEERSSFCASPAPSSTFDHLVRPPQAQCDLTGCLQLTPARQPTPHPARHRARGLAPSRLGTPSSPRDRGTSLTLSSSIPARIPRSFTGLTTYAAVWPLVRALRRLGASSWASWQASSRHGSWPKVRASLHHTSMPPHGHA